MDTLMWLWNIAKVVVGLGFVIFIHELGHFLLAKWNGVKVEKFSIGFGRTLFGFTRGETEYVIAAIPLGGFVKMLGEGGEAGEGPPDPEAAADPRAFQNQSVGARMAIMSAGVIMNVLLAIVCFAYVFGQEREVPAARVGFALAGSPAFEAGLRTGDEIVGIDGRKDVGYEDLLKTVSLSTAGQVVDFEVQRQGVEGLLNVPVHPRREPKGDRPLIGVISGFSLEVVDYQPPAGTGAPVSLPWPTDTSKPSVLVVVAAGPVGEPAVPLVTNEDFQRLSAKHRDAPLEVYLQPRVLGAKPSAKAADVVKVVLPPNRFVDLGLRFAAEPIRSIQKGSPAEAAGLQVGDRIVKVDGRDDYDPMRLVLECFDKAGTAMSFEIQRKDEKGAMQDLTIAVTPDDTSPIEASAKLPSTEDLQIPGLGIALAIKPVVQAVVPGSPADEAGIKVGDVVDAATFPVTKGLSRPGLGTTEGRMLLPRERAFRLDEEATWPFVFGLIQTLPLQPVLLTVHGRSEPISLNPVVMADWYSSDRGLDFNGAYRTAPSLGFAAALKAGLDETIENISVVYATIRSLFTGQVSFNQTVGPIGIFQIAHAAARSGLSDFLRFLGVISVNLAVLNFLPIPPLDGGQMFFLIAEKVRGRPLPESTLVVGTYIGLLLVLCLMLCATYQDVLRLLKSFFFL